MSSMDNTVENAAPATAVRGQRKEREGVVVSDCQEKTIVVVVERRAPHAIYRKVVRSSKRYTAHDEKNEAKVGDRVRIVETRPLSKRKRWRLVEVVRRAE
jgi:small subunit ribosomal protein S17